MVPEPEYCFLLTLNIDINAITPVIDVPVKPIYRCQPADKRAKADSLDQPLY